MNNKKYKVKKQKQFYEKKKQLEGVSVLEKVMTLPKFDSKKKIGAKVLIDKWFIQEKRLKKENLKNERRLKKEISKFVDKHFPPLP